MNYSALKPVFATLASLVAVLATASAATYSQNFNAFPDNTSILGDGTIISSNDGLASVQGGQFRIASDSISGETSVLRIPALANAAQGWTMTFNVSFSDTAGENPPADGMSISWGNIPFNTTLPGVDGVTGFGAEHGWQLGSAGDHLAFEIDTWQNGGPDQGVRIATEVGGVHTHVAQTVGQTLPDGGSVSGLVTLSWDPILGASFSTTGLGTNANFTNVPVPGFVGSDAFIFAFASRTGNADETVLIDNVNITTVPEASSVFLGAFAGLGLLSVRRRK